MSKRHFTQQSFPFPSPARDDAFGHYISGFTDGEGNFMLYQPKAGMKYSQLFARFSIELRADDTPALAKIRDYFGCGKIRYRERPNHRSPMTSYAIQATAHLATIIIPHFDRYTLRAKKLDDYLVWKDGVLLLHAIKQRPKRAIGRGGGFYRTWAEEDHARFSELVARLKRCRVFRPASE